jgi:hypothetical protein
VSVKKISPNFSAHILPNGDRFLTFLFPDDHLQGRNPQAPKKRRQKMEMKMPKMTAQKIEKKTKEKKC